MKYLRLARCGIAKAIVAKTINQKEKGNIDFHFDFSVNYC